MTRLSPPKLAALVAAVVVLVVLVAAGLWWAFRGKGPGGAPGSGNGNGSGPSFGPSGDCAPAAGGAPGVITNVSLTAAPWKLPVATLRAAAGSAPGFEQAVYPHLRGVLQNWDADAWKYKKRTVSAAAVRAFVGALLALKTDPFGGQHLSVPWGDVGPAYPQGKPSFLGLSQLAVAYLLARFAMQDDLGGAAAGGRTASNLATALDHCGAMGAIKGDVQAYSVWSLLAVASVDLSADGGLRAGCHVIYARGPSGPGAAADWVDAAALASAPLPRVGACAVHCSKPDDQTSGCSSADLSDVLWSPQGGAPLPPCSVGAAADSMQAPVEGLGVVDVSAQTIGGGAWFCGLAQQDESSPTFYPEIIVLSIFLLPLPPDPQGRLGVNQLPVPCLVFGCRTFLATYVQLGSPCGGVDKKAPLSPNIILACSSTSLAGHSICVYRRSFVHLFGPNDHALFKPGDPPCGQATLNNIRYLTSWAATSMSPAGYAPEVYGAWKASFRVLGGVPWGAGAFQGSISNYFLALVLGLAAANVDVRKLLGAEFALDLMYYFYSWFCDAGTGLAGQGCALCSYCRPTTPPPGAFALPGGATMLDGLDQFPECSFASLPCGKCGDPDSEMRVALGKLKGMDFAALWAKIVYKDPSKCNEYAQSARALSPL